MEDTQPLAQRALGETEALTIAVHALLKTPPQRDLVAATIREGIEGMLATVEPQPYPQPFVDGLRVVRDHLLQAPPGHPADVLVR